MKKEKKKRMKKSVSARYLSIRIQLLHRTDEEFQTLLRKLNLRHGDTIAVEYVVNVSR